MTRPLTANMLRFPTRAVIHMIRNISTETKKPHTLRTKDEFRQLMSSLKDGPMAGTRLSITGVLRNVFRGCLSCDALVDKWPNYTAMLLRPSKETQQFLGNWVMMYATDVRKLEELLCFPGAMPWRETFIIEALPLHLKNLIQTVASRSGSRADSENSKEFIIVKSSQNMKITHVPKLPEGYYASSLKPDDADFVNKEWQYGGTAQSERRIRFLITNMATTGIYDKTGQLVAWTIEQYDNSSGMSFTVPEHQRFGLGFISQKILIKKMLEMNEGPVLGSILPSNKNMLRIADKLEFERLPGKLTYVVCKPESPLSSKRLQQ